MRAGGALRAGGAVKGGAEKSPDENEEEEQTPVAGERQFRV